MKLDLKIFQIFILLLLIYGAGYYFGNLGKFIFPVDYTHFVIGLISLIFLLSTKFSWFSVLLLPFGISLIYLMFPENFREHFDLIGHGSKLLFLSLLLIYLFRNKNKEYKIYFIILIFFSFLTLIINSIFGGVTIPFSILKMILAIKFIILLFVLRKNKESEKLDIGIKRFIIVLGMYYFVELMSFSN